MNTTILTKLPVVERLRIVEELWESIEKDQQQIPLSQEQKDEIDRVLDAMAHDGDPGRPANEVIAELRNNL